MRDVLAQAHNLGGTTVCSMSAAANRRRCSVSARDGDDACVALLRIRRGRTAGGGAVHGSVLSASYGWSRMQMCSPPYLSGGYLNAEERGAEVCCVQRPDADRCRRRCSRPGFVCRTVAPRELIDLAELTRGICSKSSSLRRTRPGRTRRRSRYDLRPRASDCRADSAIAGMLRRVRRRRARIPSPR